MSSKVIKKYDWCCRIFYFLLLLVQVSGTANAQSSKVNRKDVVRLFRISAKEQRGGISNSWIICNADSSYYLADTLMLINSTNYSYSVSSCCKYIEWSFFKKNLFVRREVNVCNEPSISTVANDDDWFHVRFSKEGSGIYIQLVNADKLCDTFKVVEVSKVEVNEDEVSVIILLRDRSFK